MLDANCSYTVPEARRLATSLDDIAISWLEEPLQKGDYAAHADLRRRVDVPIATGENFYNETQFKQVVDADAADYLQRDVCRVDGITPWITVAEHAAAADLSVSPHYIEPIHAHLVCLFDNVPYMSTTRRCSTNCWQTRSTPLMDRFTRQIVPGTAWNSRTRNGTARREPITVTGPDFGRLVGGPGTTHGHRSMCSVTAGDAPRAAYQCTRRSDLIILDGCPAGPKSLQMCRYSQ